MNKNLVQNTENVNKNNAILSTIQKTAITPCIKRKSKNFLFQILRGTSFLMIPLTTLYDDDIDRPKLTEQENPFEYLFPPAH